MLRHVVCALLLLGIVSAVGCDPCASSAGDSDDDGVCDAVDNCVGDANVDQSDADDDGVGDACDNSGCPDGDDDGICDDVDNCVDVANPGQTDGDLDDIGDACDDEDACDGLDHDGDGVADEDAIDEDADGFCDDLDDCVDIDGDGACGDDDNCPTVANNSLGGVGQTDVDNDGIGDVCDVEECDGVDNDGDFVIDEELADEDDDGVCDHIDPCEDDVRNDDDDDGLCGAVDNCPGVANVDQADTDSDGVGDACDLDLVCGVAADVVDEEVPATLTVRVLLAASATRLYIASDVELLAIDHERIIWRLPIDEDPRTLAVSADGAKLYLGFGSRPEVRLVDTVGRRLCGQFGLGDQAPFGAIFPSQLSVSPLDPNVVVVSGRYRGFSPDYAGTFVYDSGQRRRRATHDHDGAQQFVFVDDDTLFGGDSSSVCIVDIDARGATNRFEQLGIGGSDAPQSARGRVVTLAGVVFDASDPTVFARFENTQGTFALNNALTEAVYVLPTGLEVFDIATQAHLRTLPLPFAAEPVDFLFQPVLAARTGASGMWISFGGLLVVVDDAFGD